VRIYFRTDMLVLFVSVPGEYTAYAVTM